MSGFEQRVALTNALVEHDGFVVTTAQMIAASDAPLHDLCKAWRLDGYTSCADELESYLAPMSNKDT